MHAYDDLVKQAFFRELRLAYDVADLDLEKVASDPRVAELLKEARIRQALQAAASRLTPSGRQLAKYDAQGVGDVAREALKKQQPSAKLEAWGKAQRQSPVERVRAAGMQVKPEEAGDLYRATERMGGTSMGKRLMGGTAEGAGHHMAHTGTVGKALNPIGVPVGGGVEGGMKQLGREAANAGLPRMSRGLTRAAKPAGLVAEIGTVAGAGTLAGAPLSAAGAKGTGMLHAIGMKAPLKAAIGDYGAHFAADALGTGATASTFRKGVKMAPSLARRAVGAVMG